ncbi:MAG: putative toxin-antitoxin system toxin component, PIN family [Gammaproteobacteria bacterium]|nr:putative toxin-antitoxin system toxin component, PIN family [Gammaproteobacteria bacterium]
MKVVLDTNILVSGLMYPTSTPGRIIAAWSEAQFDVVTTHEQLAEIGRVLGYPKIRRILKWDDDRIERFIEHVYLRVDVVEARANEFEALRDPEDTPILGALVAAQADLLVTGDRDLLVLWNRFPIETPAEFVRRI